MSDPKRLLARTVLAVLFVLSALRLAGFVWQFAQQSLQLDFSAFYAAGEAHRRGLSPYLTHANLQPPIWDGTDAYRHSRFLYPPLVAAFFAAFTHLGYGTAKSLWMLLSLGCLGGALWACGSALRLRWETLTVLGLGTWVCLFHPLLPLLERGQIDAVTLLLIMLAIRPLVRDGRESLGSGLLLAAATLFKVNVVLFVPFVIWRRRWRVLTGYLLGGVALAGATVAIQGPDALRNYLTRELPRIARFGEGGTVEMRLPGTTLLSLRGDSPDGQARREGHLYRVDSLGFVANASLARVVGKHRGEGETSSRLALVILAAAMLLLAGVQQRGRESLTPLGEMVYWQAVMTAVLLAGPLTWAMNTVWLLPAGLVVLAAWRDLRGRLSALALAFLVLGLLLAAIPDHHGFALLSPAALPVLHQKYVLAELMVFAGLLGLLAGLPRSDPATLGTHPD